MRFFGYLTPLYRTHMATLGPTSLTPSPFSMQAAEAAEENAKRLKAEKEAAAAAKKKEGTHLRASHPFLAKRFHGHRAVWVGACL